MNRNADVSPFCNVYMFLCMLLYVYNRRRDFPLIKDRIDLFSFFPEEFSCSGSGWTSLIPYFYLAERKLSPRDRIAEKFRITRWCTDETVMIKPSEIPTYLAFPD